MANKYYALIANSFPGIYFDETEFEKAKSFDKETVSETFENVKKAVNFVAPYRIPKKFYVIKRGRIKGIFFAWDDCKQLVEAYQGAVYKSFKSIEEAVDFYEAPFQEYYKPYRSRHEEAMKIKNEYPFAYVDGSYNDDIKTYGYGVFLGTEEGYYEFSGSDNDPGMVSMRNVSGEINGAMRAVTEAIKLGLPKINIYYDYQGIEKWATGEWARNREGTIRYYNFIQNARKQIDINFVKVKAHSNIEYNEKVDRIAKRAVGLI